MAWSASVGLTTVVNFSNDSAAAEILYDDGTAFTRMRHSLGARDSTTAFNQLNDSIDAIIASPIDDFFRSDLIGEFAVRTLDISGNSPLPTNYDEAAALIELVEEVVAPLDERGRTIVRLRLQDYSIEEIAQQVDRTERTVRRILDRVKLLLQRQCNDGADDSHFEQSE